MSGKAIPMILFAAAALVLAGCQQQSEKPTEPQAPAAMQPAPAPQPEPPAAMTAKPETAPPAPKPAAPVAMTPKPAPAAAPAPVKPAASTAMTAKPEAAVPAPKPAVMPATAKTFNTAKCAACHAIDHDKVGPAWKTVAEKYGDAATLAKDFASGFKERRVANSIAKWKPKEGLMTSQFNSLIKGHEKEAAHALFESVKQGKFGDY